MIQVRSLLALLSLVLIGAEPSHVVIPGDSRPTAGRIEEARRRLDAGKGEDGVELLRSLIDATSNDLAAVGEGRSVSARLLSHALIAKLPPADLAVYRKRIEVQARRWLEQADATGEVGPLHR